MALLLCVTPPNLNIGQDTRAGKDQGTVTARSSAMKRFVFSFQGKSSLNIPVSRVCPGSPRCLFTGKQQTFLDLT